MPVVAIAIERITDWDSFHDAFAEVLGFPDYYGRNLDAWIDCLTYADDADAGMIDPALIAPNGDVLTLQLGILGDSAERCSEQYDALPDCTAFVKLAQDRDSRSTDRRTELLQEVALAFGVFANTRPSGRSGPGE